MLLLVLLVTFALLAVCLQTCKAHLITLLSSLEEQQMLELILNCNHSLCGWLQNIVVVILSTCTFFYTFRFGFPLLLRVKDAGRQLLERDEAVLCAEVALAASLLMRLEIGKRYDREERYFEEPALKLKPFQGYPG